jgi:DNA-binding transcriptional MerR regulator
VQSKQSIGITAAAQAAEVHPGTIRRWEKRGLISPIRTWAGHRRFGPEEIAVLRALAGVRSR